MHFYYSVVFLGNLKYPVTLTPDALTDFSPSRAQRMQPFRATENVENMPLEIGCIIIIENRKV